ncbi:hypothetical protein ACW185_08110 [Limosilactobacillus fermentum]
MLPMLDEVATPTDWKMVRDDEEEIGYTPDLSTAAIGNRPKRN